MTVAHRFFRSIPRLAWVFAAAGLLLLVALRYVGPKSTDTARQDLLALEGLIPPPVSDDQNFAAIPSLRGLWDIIATGQAPMELRAFRRSFNPIPSLDLALSGQENARYGMIVRQRDVDLAGALEGFKHVEPALGESPAQTILRTFEPISEILGEISTGLRRPHCRFPIQYERGYDAVRPPFGFFVRLTQLYGLRAAAYLQVDNAQAAAEDIVSMLRMGRHWRTDPGALRVTTGGMMQHYATQFIWLGMKLDRWSVEQLNDFRRELEDVDLFAESVRSFRMDLRDILEAGCSVEDGWKPLPTDGIVDRAHKAVCRRFAMPFYSSCMAALARSLARLHATLPHQRPTIFEPAVVIQAKVDFDAARWNWDGGAIHFFRSDEIPVMFMRRVVALQSSLEQCVCAIEIEKHRRRNGSYPASLAGLAVPADLLTGRPRTYEVSGDGAQYRLESVPWSPATDEELPTMYGVAMTKWNSMPE